MGKKATAAGLLTEQEGRALEDEAVRAFGVPEALAEAPGQGRRAETIAAPTTDAGPLDVKTIVRRCGLVLERAATPADLARALRALTALYGDAP